MTRTFKSFASACFTPIKAMLAILTIMIVVAASSEETAGSGDPNTWTCSGPSNPWNPGPSNPNPPAPASFAAPNLSWITLTQVGTPIWQPVDFQMFTAPADPFPAAFNHVIDQLLPFEGPGAASYMPHAGPYNTELSTNAAAAGFVNQNVFPKNAITLNPNGVYLTYMMMPAPGVTGSSRDFASGPIIPNSLFPMASKAEMFLNGALVETLQDQNFNPRTGDLPFDGASHRAPVQVVWHPWANDPNAGPLGSHVLKWTLRDNQNNGWDISAPFSVIPEPSSLAIAGFGLTGACLARRRRGRNASNRD